MVLVWMLHVVHVLVGVAPVSKLVLVHMLMTPCDGVAPHHVLLLLLHLVVALLLSRIAIARQR